MDPANICLNFDVNFEDSIVGFYRTFTHLDGREISIKESNIIKDGDIKGIIASETKYVHVRQHRDPPDAETIFIDADGAWPRLRIEDF